MKVILDDVYYKGIYIETYECDLPNVKSLDDIPEGKLIEYITDSMDQTIELFTNED